MINYNAPLIAVHNNGNIAQAMIANALSVINVEVGNPATRSIFEDLVGPPKGQWRLDRPFRADGQGGPSTCSMIALGLLRRLNVDDNTILAKYQPGSGFLAARRYAKAMKAWLSPRKGDRPYPGDIIELKSAKTSNDPSNHTATVVAWEQDNLCTVDGGQVGLNGLQAIRLLKRPWSDLQLTAGNRPVDGWIQLELLDFRNTLIVPQGWDNLDEDDALQWNQKHHPKFGCRLDC